MKKRFSIAALTAALAMLSSYAQAQNSVTLYGIVDAGLMYVHNSAGQSTQVSLVSGSQSGSRWGLTGTEDLGGGLGAMFKIENGFNVTNGKLNQGGREFGRQAYVGLSGSSWGQVTAGRQYDPLVDLVQPIQGDHYLSGFFSTPGDVDNADNSARISNAVKWSSPDWSGLRLKAMYSFGGVAGSVGSGQTYSAAGAYNTGALALAAGYLHIDNGNPSLSARGTTTSDTLFYSSVNDAYATARSINIARAGGNYTFGSVIVGGYYSFSQYNPDSSSTFTHAEKYNNGSIYAVWHATPQLQSELGYDYLKSAGDSSAKYQQVSLGADYFLSKRTDVYGVASYGHASGSNGAGTAQAVIGSSDIDAGKNAQALFVVGLRHRF